MEFFGNPEVYYYNHQEKDVIKSFNKSLGSMINPLMLKISTISGQ